MNRTISIGLLCLTLAACGDDSGPTDPELTIFEFSEMTLHPNPITADESFVTTVELTVSPQQSMVYTELVLVLPGNEDVLASSADFDFVGKMELEVQSHMSGLTSRSPGDSTFILRWKALDAGQIVRASTQDTLRVTS